MSTYIWKIPNSDPYKNRLLAHGFIRRITSQQYIIDPIIDLFATYYESASFTLSDIQHARNLQLFVSPIFSYDSFQWYLELHPNGSNMENKGSVILYLCLVMIPTNISKISISFELSLAETKTTFRRIKSFDSSKWYMGWRRDTLLLSQIKDLPQLTFSVDINLISVTELLTINGTTTEDTRLCKIADTKNLNILSTTSRAVATYKWWITDTDLVDKIRNCDISEHFNGPMMRYGPFKCYLQFIPKQPKMRSPWIGFRVWYCPPFIDKCLCKIDIIFNELRIWKSTYKLFQNRGLLSVWAVTFTEEEYEIYQRLNSYSFTVDISVIDIVYKEHDEERMPLYPRVFAPVSQEQLAVFEYEWNIKGSELKQVQQAANVFSFISPIFEAYSLKWYLSLWPNGSRESRKGNMNIFLLLVSFHDISLKVPIRFDLEWRQSRKTCTEYQIFRVDQCCGGETIWPLKHEAIKELDAVTVKLTISIADIMIDDKLATKQYMIQHKHNTNAVIQARDVSVPCEIFTWRVPPASLRAMQLLTPSMDFKSDVFNMYDMQWFLVFYPNGNKADNNGHTVMNIHLVELPADKAIVSVRYTLYIEESETRYGGEATFREEHMVSSWDTERISSERFKDLSTFTVELSIELVDVYHRGYRITNRYLPRYYVSELRHNVLFQLEIDEMDYIIDNMRILNEESINRDMEDIKEDKADMSVDEYKDELHEWCCDTLKMPEYYNLFVNHWIHDLQAVKLLDENCLIAIGVLSVEERTKILIEIAILTFTECIQNTT